jgi:hypothetical protein
MARKGSNNKLRNAKKSKNDEFYTQLSDIESELQHYDNHFKDKVVFCNCDDARISNFFKYFAINFHKLGLKKLIAASYQEQNNGFYFEYTGKENEKKIPTTEDLIYFEDNGDFRKSGSTELLNQSDIVVTNPPFSLFREYVNQLIQYDKKFLIIGNINAITYKEIFQIIQDDKAWLGINLGRGISGFIVPEHYELYGTEVKIDSENNRIVSSNNCLWLTNLDNNKRHELLQLTEMYVGNEDNYPTYDNYDGINVNEVIKIPADYSGAMGVPITFLHKFNPEQFRLIKFRKGDNGKDLSINGKCPYFRILIKNRLL